MSKLLPTRPPTAQEISEARVIANTQDEDCFFEDLKWFIQRLFSSDPSIPATAWNPQDFSICLYISWKYSNKPTLSELNALYMKLAGCLEIKQEDIQLTHLAEFADVGPGSTWIGFVYNGAAISKNIWKIILNCFTLDKSILPEDIKELVGEDPRNYDLAVGMQRVQSRVQDME